MSLDTCLRVDKQSFEQLLTKQSSTLLSSSTEQFEETLQRVAQDALQWFDFDRASLLPNRNSAYNEEKVLSFCKAGIVDIFSVGKKVNLAPYLKFIAHRQTPLVFNKQEIQASNVEVLQLMAKQGVVWHCVLPLKIFGKQWGAIAAARFSERGESIDKQQLERFKLLGEVWASYWQYAVLSRNARVEHGVSKHTHNAISYLSSRQKEVLSLLAAGFTAKEVASKLCLSSRTVESHKYKIMDTLELNSTAQLIQFAVSNGLIVG